MLEDDVRKLETFQLRCLRRICKLSYLTHTSNADVLRKCKVPCIAQTLRAKRVSWMGHVWRMNESRLPQILWHWNPSDKRDDAHRTSGGQYLRYADLLTEEFRPLRLSFSQAIRTVHFKSRWKSYVKALSSPAGSDDAIVKRDNK